MERGWLESGERAHQCGEGEERVWGSRNGDERTRRVPLEFPIVGHTYTVTLARGGGVGTISADVLGNIFLKINLVRMFAWADSRGSEPSLSIACCAGLDPTTRSRNSSAMAEFYPNV